MRYSLMLIYLLLATIIFPFEIEARITPEDILNEKKSAYFQAARSYSTDNQEKLTKLSLNIAQMNKQKTDHLSWVMGGQAAILDEYVIRAELGGKLNQERVEKARYWITYAHEAVAYQAAKVYVFQLSNEQNIKRDTLSTISLLNSELNSTRNKVINSQKILQEVIGK